MPDDCPHTMQIGALDARVTALEKSLDANSLSFESRLNELSLKMQLNADQVLEEKSKKSGFFRGVHITATLTGYFVLMVLLLIAGKITGGIDQFIKMIASLGFKV
ncbi:hypothetical protein [Nitrosomonas supralitoralis]|uniref:Uncharacterized protein n=1 Tax=Nitrosomonas supralitoralis TaxID=2116706 RepID=A0A2P7NQR2_9PROT|nr:hypothetical protein [Nitrosomonas supralitoralis]PSJ15826.1 hypothetical protein C7H79_16885 [Nitrosomonas supralitoralis]